MNNSNKPRVLVVDDAPVIVVTVRKIVADILNYEVVGEASNGLEALERFYVTKPDIVLLDIHMPIKTGIDVLREIAEVAPETVVIMLSSIFEENIVETCNSLGAANYILKGTSLNQMSEIIKETWREYSQVRL